jgi:F-type H+-transporting ATPase subunit delta
VRSQEIARRYATALYQVSTEDATGDEIARELAEMATAASEDADVRRFLSHPLVPREEKSAFLARAFPETSERMRNFLHLLIHNRREGYLQLIYREFIDIQAEAEGVIQVDVSTAHALSDEDKTRLSERLETALHHPVRLNERVEEDLIGGLRVETDGHVLDATIRSRLDRLQRELEE